MCGSDSLRPLDAVILARHLIAELATAGPGRSHWTLWIATLTCLLAGAAAGAALFIAWRPGAPLVAILLVGAVIAAARLSSKNQEVA